MASQPFTPAQRIQELSEINAEVASMVNAAGQAVSLLANRPPPAVANGTDGVNGEDAQMNDAEPDLSIEARQAAFTAHTTQYYEGLQSVIARLRRQAYALEEAGILLSKAPTISAAGQQRDSSSNQAPGRSQPGTADLDRITNGGLGNFDVGWLNSRGNKVGAEKEVELVMEAKRLAQQALDASSLSQSTT